MAAKALFSWCSVYLILIASLNNILSEYIAENKPKQRINIILLGATGDLARRYLWKGLFNLFASKQESLENTSILLYGAARVDNEKGSETLTKVLHSSIKCADDTCRRIKTEFLKASMYHRLKYDSDYKALQNNLESNKEVETGRIFYLSVPPFAYEDISINIAAYCRPKSSDAWVRVVLEKPFGSNFKTAEELSDKLSRYWKEHEIYRIDHYLGKTGVLQIREFKKENQEFFNQMWNQENVERVKIVVKEHGDAKGRMAFYDHYGVIRDMFQNHLTEILALVASEMPQQSSEKDVKNSEEVSEKSKLLSAVQDISIQDALFGQYKDYYSQLKSEISNIENDSYTPTFSAVLVQIQNKRWSGVPFILVSGKHLDSRLAYVQIQFKQQKFCIENELKFKTNNCKQKEITFYIQGDKFGEALTIVSKSLPNIRSPETWQNLSFNFIVSSLFESGNIIMSPGRNQRDAYTSLIEDVYLGNKENFVSVEDLLRSWKIWESLLEKSTLIKPRLYSRDNLESLDFEIIDKKIKFVSDAEYENPAQTRYADDVDQSLSFRGNKLVSGSPESVIQQLANDIANAVQRKVQTGEFFHLALSGGSTPKHLFQILSNMKYIPWSHVHIWMVDERCVSFTDKESNFKTVNELLINYISIPYLNIHPMMVDLVGEICEARDFADKMYERTLRYHLVNGSLDFVVLGVGNDGHTASLFPGSTLLMSSNWVEFTESFRSYKRLTMTLLLLNQSEDIAVLMLGDEKCQISQTLSAMNSKDLPINMIKPVHGSLTWYIDDNALRKTQIKKKRLF